LIISCAFVGSVYDEKYNHIFKIRNMNIIFTAKYVALTCRNITCMYIVCLVYVKISVIDQSPLYWSVCV
jgi:hypothetical protein